VLPYVHQGAVETHQWLSATQMMDGLALGETTPGPLIMVVAFVAFLGGWQQQALGPEALFAAGALGAGIVTFFTFLPSFIFILAGGPLVEGTRGRLGFTAPLTAISAAVVGVILSLGLVFAQAVLWPQGLQAALDWKAGLMAAGATLAVLRFQLGVLPLLVVCGGAGLALSLLS
jgi:chromate transporter